jgi:hypothetical protein
VVVKDLVIGEEFVLLETVANDAVVVLQKFM